MSQPRLVVGDGHFWYLNIKLKFLAKKNKHRLFAHFVNLLSSTWNRGTPYRSRSLFQNSWATVATEQHAMWTSNDKYPVFGWFFSGWPSFGRLAARLCSSSPPEKRAAGSNWVWFSYTPKWWSWEYPKNPLLPQSVQPHTTAINALL